MYENICLTLGVLFYITYIISPFISVIRRWIMSWDEDLDALALFYVYFAIEDLINNKDNYKVSETKLIFYYICCFILLGIFFSMLLTILWPLILIIIVIIYIFKRVIKTIKNKQKNK